MTVEMLGLLYCSTVLCLLMFVPLGDDSSDIEAVVRNLLVTSSHAIEAQGRTALQKFCLMKVVLKCASG